MGLKVKFTCLQLFAKYSEYNNISLYFFKLIEELNFVFNFLSRGKEGFFCNFPQHAKHYQFLLPPIG